MNRIFWLAIFLLVFLAVGCDDENESTPSFPAEPTTDMLENGPGEGSEFFWWSDSGRARATAANFRAVLWVNNMDTTHVQIEDMVGLYIYPGCLGTHPELECDIVVKDPNYSQLEYGPTGMVFADSVELWIDSTVIDLPDGTYTSDVSYFYYNPETGEFEEQETWVDPENGWIECRVLHFSRYILGRKLAHNN
jgi:hypothetical protein